MYPQSSVRDRPDLAVRQLSSLPTRPRHVSLVDRVALRVGLWLLVRSTERAHDRLDHAVHADRRRLDREREARELAYQRERLLWLL